MHSSTKVFFCCQITFDLKNEPCVIEKEEPTPEATIEVLQ